MKKNIEIQSSYYNSLADHNNIKEVILFPAMKPKDEIKEPEK